MKTFILSVLMLMIIATSYGQLSVRTENASNIYSYHSALTTGDTIVTVGTTTYGTPAFIIRGLYLVGIQFGKPVASDTTIILNGLGTVLYVVQTSDVKPYFIPLGCRIDTSLIFIQKKASFTTLIYRVSN